jgi:hypothetical protein
MQHIVGIGKHLQRIIRRLWRGQSTTIRQERCDLSTSFMDLCDSVDSVQMIHSGVKKEMSELLKLHGQYEPNQDQFRS